MCKLMEDMRNEASGKSEYNKAKNSNIFYRILCYLKTDVV